MYIIIFYSCTEIKIMEARDNNEFVLTSAHNPHFEKNKENHVLSENCHFSAIKSQFTA